MLDPIDKPRSRFLLSIALGIVIFLGLASRKYGASLPDFFANHADDALWTMAVYLSLAFLAPKSSPLKLGLLALGVSIIVELSQLIDAAWLNAIRNTLPGRLLLGAGFLWMDLARYFCGALIAYAIDTWYHRKRLLV